MSGLGEDTFCIKKGSRVVHEMVAYVLDPADNVLYDFSAYDTTELFVYDAQGGTLLFTITGTITQNESKLTYIFAVADTVSLANNTGWYNIKLSASADATLDKYFVEGVVNFGV
jgi:hypothetical protein